MPRSLSPNVRARVMRSIRKVDTKPELAVRRVVYRLGFRYRLHQRGMPGSPDLVLSRLRAVILVHGCFWHQHTGCRLARTPRVNQVPKLERKQIARSGQS